MQLEINLILIFMIGMATILLLVYNNFIVDIVNAMQTNLEILINLFTFGIAYLTLWKTVLSPANIAITIGNRMSLYFVNFKENGQEKSLASICLPLNIVNTGAKTGLIENIALRVTFDTESIIYNINSEMSEIKVDIKEGDVNVEKMQEKMKDYFAALMISGNSKYRINYLFLPADKNEITINKEPPFYIKVEIFALINKNWKKYDNANYINKIVNIKNKRGHATIDSEESLKSIRSLLSNTDYLKNQQILNQVQDDTTQSINKSLSYL